MFYLSLRTIPAIHIAFAEYPKYNNIANKKFAGNVNNLLIDSPDQIWLRVS